MEEPGCLVRAPGISADRPDVVRRGSPHRLDRTVRVVVFFAPASAVPACNIDEGRVEARKARGPPDHAARVDPNRPHWGCVAVLHAGPPPAVPAMSDRCGRLVSVPSRHPHPARRRTPDCEIVEAGVSRTNVDSGPFPAVPVQDGTRAPCGPKIVRRRAPERQEIDVGAARHRVPPHAVPAQYGACLTRDPEVVRRAPPERVQVALGTAHCRSPARAVAMKDRSKPARGPDVVGRKNPDREQGVARGSRVHPRPLLDRAGVACGSDLRRLLGVLCRGLVRDCDRRR